MRSAEGEGEGKHSKLPFCFLVVMLYSGRPVYPIKHMMHFCIGLERFSNALQHRILKHLMYSKMVYTSFKKRNLQCMIYQYCSVLFSIVQYCSRINMIHVLIIMIPSRHANTLRPSGLKLFARRLRSPSRLRTSRRRLPHPSPCLSCGPFFSSSPPGGARESTP